MIGRSTFASASSFWRSSPLNPGRRTSSTRQPDPSGRMDRKNSCAESKVWASSPTDRTSLLSDKQIAGSSSTTNTIGRLSLINFLGAGRQRELESCTCISIGNGPQFSAVSFNDGTADGQSHTHALRLGSEEGVENMFHAFGVESRSGILHHDLYAPGFVGLRTDQQDTRPVCYRSHGLDTVHDQVQDDLLQLDPITQNWS